MWRIDEAASRRARDILSTKETQAQLLFQLRIENKHMCSMVEEYVSAWEDENEDILPTQSLFYRDGVAESLLLLCKTEEIEQAR